MYNILLKSIIVYYLGKMTVSTSQCKGKEPLLECCRRSELMSPYVLQSCK